MPAILIIEVHVPRTIGFQSVLRRLKKKTTEKIQNNG